MNLLVYAYACSIEENLEMAQQPIVKSEEMQYRNDYKVGTEFDVLLPDGRRVRFLMRKRDIIGDLYKINSAKTLEDQKRILSEIAAKRIENDKDVIVVTPRQSAQTVVSSAPTQAPTSLEALLGRLGEDDDDDPAPSALKISFSDTNRKRLVFNLADESRSALQDLWYEDQWKIELAKDLRTFKLLIWDDTELFVALFGVKKETPKSDAVFKGQFNKSGESFEFKTHVYRVIVVASWESRNGILIKLILDIVVEQLPKDSMQVVEDEYDIKLPAFLQDRSGLARNNSSFGQVTSQAAPTPPAPPPNQPVSFSFPSSPAKPASITDEAAEIVQGLDEIKKYIFSMIEANGLKHPDTYPRNERHLVTGTPDEQLQIMEERVRNLLNSVLQIVVRNDLHLGQSARKTVLDLQLNATIDLLKLIITTHNLTPGSFE
jgi:hypothetical protein